MITDKANLVPIATRVPFLMNFAEADVPLATLEGLYDEQKQMFVQYPVSNGMGDLVLNQGSMTGTLSGSSSDSDSD